MDQAMTVAFEKIVIKFCGGANEILALDASLVRKGIPRLQNKQFPRYLLVFQAMRVNAAQGPDCQRLCICPGPDQGVTQRYPRQPRAGRTLPGAAPQTGVCKSKFLWHLMPIAKGKGHRAHGRKQI